MNLALVSLPWSMHTRPSAALGALSAFLRCNEPGWSVECFHEYVSVAMGIGATLYGEVAYFAYDVGELLYAPLLYPTKKSAALGSCAQTLRDLFETDMGITVADLSVSGATESSPTDWESFTEDTHRRLGSHLDGLVASIAGKFDAVGLTTSFGQLFANLAFSKRLKEASPGTKIILGGSTISGAVGPSLLAEYPFLDYVIQGEGELPLLHLLRGLADGQPDLEVKGVLRSDTASRFPGGVPLWEVPNINILPMPQFDDYAQLAEKHHLLWELPVEGSRGCWWDRAKKTGNPKNTCYFCNLNVQWNGYREKSAERVVSEVEYLSDRYGQGRLFFLDNIIRAKGIEELATRLGNTGRDLSIFYEMRANAHPYQLLLLWRAGLQRVQFGIEGLSTSYLRRIGKGTSTIQNLQVMKTCQELGIENRANLLTDFPGGTQDEVELTRQVMLDYAYAYEPVRPNPFWLGTGATVDSTPAEFPVRNIRNKEFYRLAVPEDAFERLRFFDLSFDSDGEVADWTGVREAFLNWRRSYAKAKEARKPPMVYFEGADFVRVEYRREEEARSHLLRGKDAELYLFCMEIRTRQQIAARFSGVLLAEEIDQRLSQWADEHCILFEENGTYLSLAPACSPIAAARRIERSHSRISEWTSPSISEREIAFPPPPLETDGISAM